MIDNRFAADSFRRLGKGTSAAKLLADELSREVTSQLQEVIADKMRQIVAQLNTLGHQLRPYGRERVGEVNYRDDHYGDTEYQCNLRLSVDLVISAGYAHILEYDIQPDCETE